MNQRPREPKQLVQGHTAIKWQAPVSLPFCFCAPCPCRHYFSLQTTVCNGNYYDLLFMEMRKQGLKHGEGCLRQNSSTAVQSCEPVTWRRGTPAHALTQVLF